MPPSGKGREGLQENQRRLISFLESEACGHSRRGHESLLFRFFGEYLGLLRASARPPCRRQAPENHVGPPSYPKPHSERGKAGGYFSATQKTGLAYCLLECYYAVNTIGAEDAEFAFVITAEVDETATTLASAG